MSVPMMTDCQKFEASSLTDIQSEIEALGVELEIEIITQKEYNDKILALSKLSSPQTTNTVSTSTVGDAEVRKLPDQSHVLQKSADLHNPQMLTIKKPKGTASRHKHTSKSIPTSPTNILIDNKEQCVSDAHIMSLINANNEKMSAMEIRLEKLTTHCEKLETLLEQRENEAFPDIEVMQTEMKKLHRTVETDDPRIPLQAREMHHQLLRRNYKDIQVCSIKGMRYWYSNLWQSHHRCRSMHECESDPYSTILFDYNTYEYVGIFDNLSRTPWEYDHNFGGKGILVNPVYAVKYKDKYPEIFDICISQKRDPVTCASAARRSLQQCESVENPWAIFTDRCRGSEHKKKALLASPAAIQVQLEEDYDLHIKTGVYSFKYESLQ